MTYVKMSKRIKNFVSNKLRWPKIPNYIRILSLTLYDLWQRYALTMSQVKSS